MTNDEFWRQLFERAKKLDELSYYEVLSVDPTAAPEVVKRAFYNLANMVHPDRHARERDPERRYALTLVYATMREAFAVLSNREDRARYDRALGQGKRRLEDEKKNKPRATISNPRARRFFELGQERLRSGARESARQQFEFALQMDPDSETIKQALRDLTGDPASSESPAMSPESPVLARQFPRAKYSDPVQIRCSTWKQFVTLYARDLSQGGILVRGTTGAAVGERVRVCLTVPDGQQLDVEATVRRSAPDKDDPKLTNLGLRFEPLDKAAEAKLAALMQAAGAAATRKPPATPPPIPPNAKARVAGPTTRRPARPSRSPADSGRYALSEGRYREACTRLEAALGASPESSELRAALHLARGYVAKQEGRFTEARREFEQVLDCDPLSEEAICELRSRELDDVGQEVEP